MLTRPTLDEHLDALDLNAEELAAVRAKIDRLAARARTLVEQYTPGVTDAIDVDPENAISDLIADLLILGATINLEPDVLIERARHHTEATITPDGFTLTDALAA